MRSMPGILHLHGGDAPVVEHGAVHLRQRGGGNRLGVELAEDGLERLPSSRSTTARTASKGSGGTSSWRSESTSTYSSGKRSGRVLRNCAVLISRPWLWTAAW